jgi:colicin import membrane protein
VSAKQAFAGFGTREEPALARSAALSFLVHLVLVGAIFLGVRWQSHQPQTVVVELWESPPPPPAIQAPPPPAPEPPAPKPAPEPEPQIEKPDIALKAPAKLKLKPETQLKPPPEPKPKPKPKPEPKPKPQPKAKPQAKPEPLAAARAPDDEYQTRLRDELAREQATIRAEREESEMRDLIARSARESRTRALADYRAKIRGKVRGNIVLPQDIEGNPAAIFDVVQLPTGEVLSVKLRKSSGHKGYDEAVERAILKSSPLPRPEQPEIFDRELELTFRPLDK